MKSIVKVFSDKLTQAGLNQLPWLTALIFLTKDYLLYYKLITLIFLFVTIGNIGIDKVLASEKIDLIAVGKSLIVSKLFSAVLFLITTYYLIDISIEIVLISSLIVFTNIFTFGEFLFVGNHLKKPLIFSRAIIILSGVFLRYISDNLESYVYILFAESLIFSLILLANIIPTKKIEKHALSISDYSNLFLIVATSFLVTKLYLFSNTSIISNQYKFLHYFDYLVVISGVIGNLVLKNDIKVNFKKFIIYALIFESILVFFCFLFGNNILPYVISKIISSLNVFTIYLLLVKYEFKKAFLMNLPSLIIMFSYLAVTLYYCSTNVFYWMMVAEFSVIFFLYFIESKKWFSY